MNPPNQPKTDIKLIHLTQLRDAVNGLRVRAGLAAFNNWNPDPNPTQVNVTPVHHDHITQLRTKLEEALNALHLPIGSYAHSGPNYLDTVYAIDFQELRDKIKGAWTALANSAISQSYDGDGLRVKKSEYGATTFYLRSSVLGGQVLAEIDGNAVWQRGYVYAGSTIMAVQQNGVFWTFEDAVTKSKRVTDVNGNVVSIIETDPWGADTNRSSLAAFQPKKFTSYDRDGNGSDEAMFRRYNRKNSRFDQPDPYEGSYSLSDPQSFNRYAYAQNDPANFIDPSGLDALSDAISLARGALQYGSCRSLFKGDALATLNTYTSNGLITIDTTYVTVTNMRNGDTGTRTFEGPDIGAVTNFAAGAYPNSRGRLTSASPITINQNGFFMTGVDSSGRNLSTLRGLGFEGLSLAQIQAAVILHELGHVLGGSIRDDLHNPAESQRNSERVRLNCFLIPKLLRREGPLSTPAAPTGNLPLMRPISGGGPLIGDIGGGTLGTLIASQGFVDWLHTLDPRGHGYLASVKPSGPPPGYKP